MTHELDLADYLERVEKAEREQMRNWWRHMQPIDTADMSTAVVGTRQALRTAEVDARQIKAHHTAYVRVVRHLPECLDTFRLICRYGENRKESICKLAMKMRRVKSTTATAKN